LLFEDILPQTFQGLIRCIGSAYVIPTSQVRITAMLVSLLVEKWRYKNWSTLWKHDVHTKFHENPPAGWKDIHGGQCLLSG